MKVPLLKDSAFLMDVRRAGEETPASEFNLWWLGQSGFLIQWQHRHLLLDPYLSDSLTKKYALTDKPHVRMSERVVAPEELGFVDIITSSHNHTDHLDAETIVPILKLNPKLSIVIPEANREFVSNRLKIVADLPIGLDEGKHCHIHGFDIHAIASAHECIDRDDAGRCVYLGYVIEFGGWTIYHSGDTVFYPEMPQTLKQWSIDLALLPINGAKPERRVAGNLNAREAAELGREIGARCVIPCHYDLFEFNTADPADFTAACAQYHVNGRVLELGERWSSTELPRADR
jgi:L-ascorbate metabolism protein UlaG (beta-lactamase superfamily)